MKRIGSWGGLLLALLIIVTGNTGCGIGGFNPMGPTESMLLSVEATGARTLPKTALGEVPVPVGNGELVAVLFDAYIGPVLERHTDLDRCRLVTTSEPSDPDTITGIITVSATSVCRLGPNKMRVREVVTITLQPVDA